MRYTKAQKKEKWFSYGIEALTRNWPEMQKAYCCPLCLNFFDNIEYLTFEDVPPKSIGGKPLVLTCKKCNNNSGSQLDAHIKLGQDLREIYAGKKEAMIDFSCAGYKISANALFRKDRIDVLGLPTHSNPDTHKKMWKKFDEAVDNKTQIEFSITHNSLYNQWRDKIAWLRIGYLYTFATLGYKYILRPSLDIVRKQIEQPNQELIPQAIFYSPEIKPNNILIFINDPVDYKGIAVQYNKYVIFFPGCGDSAKSYYERIIFLKGDNDIQLKGKSINLPKEPKLLFDQL